MAARSTTKSRPFAVFDIDGTVARTSLYLASVHSMKRRGMLPSKDSQAIDASLQKWLKRDSDDSFEDYSATCVEVLDRALSTIKVAAYKSAVDEVIDGFTHRIYRYTTKLIKELRAKDYLIFAVSGSEHSIVGRFCRAHGFDDWIGNSYEHDGNYFTGKIGTTYKDKTIYVDSLVKKHRATMQGSVAVGDTHGDIEMLESVERPIAFNPNKTLFEYAKKSGWEIVVERKNVTYELKADSKGHSLVS